MSITVRHLATPRNKQELLILCARIGYNP